jgi:hypothetical protein
MTGWWIALIVILILLTGFVKTLVIVAILWAISWLINTFPTMRG